MLHLRESGLVTPRGRKETPGRPTLWGTTPKFLDQFGLKTLSVVYHSTQPWPYPSSLMIGLIAQVASDEATPDQTELSEVRWFTKPQARDLLAGKIEGTFAPGAMAIAHQLLKAWAESED